jgi:PST family polysaccharide transporter
MTLNLISPKVFKNFLSLGILQVANFIIPLIVAPYVIRIIGIENYGSVNVAMAVMVFFNVVVDYGFNLLATRDISLNRHDNKMLSIISSRVLICKFILLLVSAVFFSGMVLSIKSFRDQWVLFALSFTIVVGQSVLPVWFYQGIEEMKYITYFSLLSRLLTIVLIFTLIQQESDYIYINFITGLSVFLSSIFGLYRAYQKKGLKFILPAFSELKEDLQSGFLIFVSNVAYNIYSFSNIIILNFLIKDKTLIGSYSIAEKIIIIIKQILAIYTQVIYPHLCGQLNNGFIALKKSFYNSYIPFLALICIGVIVLLFAAPWAIYFFIGRFDENAIFLLRIMSFVPLIVTLNIPFYQTLLIYNFKKTYTTILVLGAFLSLSINIVFTFYFEATGTALSLLITEALIALAFFFAAKEKYYKYILPAG